MAIQENPQTATSGNYVHQTGSRSPIMRDSKLHQFFIQQIQDIYWAEKKLLKVIPKMARAATSVTLKQAFNDHLDQTATHITRLENIFMLMGEEPKALKCPAMVGIAEEGEDIIDETDNGSAQRDVGLIFAAQKVEHYEMATYGGLVQLARTMGHNEAAELLDQTLAEEKVADMLLTRIAEEESNAKALEEKIED